MKENVVIQHIQGPLRGPSRDAPVGLWCFGSRVPVFLLNHRWDQFSRQAQDLPDKQSTAMVTVRRSPC